MARRGTKKQEKSSVEELTRFSMFLVAETVKEWFSRMDWGQNDALFNTYDKVRYGSHTVSADDGSDFIKELDKSKINIL
jgi:hypothetical protein